MFRSGSTWLYNAVRLIFNANEQLSNRFSAGWIKDLNTIEKKDFMILKTHRFNGDVVNSASFVVYSYRDIRDAFASSVRKFDTQPTVKDAIRVLDDHEKWVENADYIMRYEDMRSDKVKTLKCIFESLSCKFDAFNEIDPSSDYLSDISKQIDQLTVDQVGSLERHHKDSLLYEGHITDGGVNTWKATLDENFVRELTQSCSWWFEKNGYEI